jgi:dienelactone hydrolase
MSRVLLVLLLLIALCVPSIAVAQATAPVIAARPPDGTYSYTIRHAGAVFGKSLVVFASDSAGALTVTERFSGPLTLEAQTTLDASLRENGYHFTATGQPGGTFTFSDDGAVLAIAGTTIPVKRIAGTSATLVTERLASMFALLPSIIRSTRASALTIATIGGGVNAVRADIAPIAERAPDGVPATDIGLSFAASSAAGSSVTQLWYDPRTLVLHATRSLTTGETLTLDSQTASVALPTPTPAPTPIALGPAHYSSRDVAFLSADGVRLAGTLTVPRGSAGRRAAVVLVHGSGPNDRDETIGPNKIFLQIAHALSNRGYVVLRYDKRGVAKSGGRPYLQNARDLLLADARAAVTFAAAQSEIDPRRIVVLGHSEGAELAPSLAITDRTVHAIALLGAPALPLDQVLVKQVTRGLTGPAYEKAYAAIAKENARVAASDAPDDAWLRSSFLEDPAKEIARVPCPILILQGGNDLQIYPADMPRLVNAARAAHRAITVRVLPLDDHLFIPVRSAQPYPTAEYFTPALIDPQAIDAITAWLAKVA